MNKTKIFLVQQFDSFDYCYYPVGAYTTKELADKNIELRKNKDSDLEFLITDFILNEDLKDIEDSPLSTKDI